MTRDWKTECLGHEARRHELEAERDRLLKAILHFISCDRLAYQPINNVEDARKLEHLPDDSVSATDFIEALTGIPRAALSGDAKDE